MAFSLQAGQAFLAEALGRVAGVALVYARAAGGTVTITAESGGAWVGRTAYTAVQQGAIRVEWGDRDYLIAAAALTGGVPAEGDRITETINGAAAVFEVMSPGSGEPAWRYSDPQESVYRLHVKRVA